jgi:hypothetical protein
MGLGESRASTQFNRAIMKPSMQRPLGRWSSHSDDRLPSVHKMVEDVRRDIANRTMFNIMGALNMARGFQGAQEYMQTPHPKLDGKTPFEAICAGKQDDVLALVEKLDCGVWAE